MSQRGRRAYEITRTLLKFDVVEQVRLLWFLVKWIALGSVVGAIAGLASAGFLESLSWATRTRTGHSWLLFCLPAVGLLVGLIYHYGGGRSEAGNNLILDEIHEPKTWIPRRMAPLIYVGTIATHLFGGSAGREGTAIQMSGSLNDLLARLLRLRPADRRLLLIAAIAGGFGSVFGVPLAGCIFALEVQSIGRFRHDAIVPALTASLVGDLVVRALGVTHGVNPVLKAPDLTVPFLAKVAAAGVLFGLAAILFSELTHGIQRVAALLVRWPPGRPLIGGALVVGMTYAVSSHDYLGLSLPLITRALAGGVGIAAGAFALKLVFTSVTLGSGFPGGEVTPLFVIGATLGVPVGHFLDVPVPLMAALGMVAVFAGASNTPIACTILGVELFGAGPIVVLAIACVVSYVVTAQRGIYHAQRITPIEGSDTTLTVADVSHRRRSWLPDLPGGRDRPRMDGGATGPE